MLSLSLPVQPSTIVLKALLNRSLATLLKESIALQALASPHYLKQMFQYAVLATISDMVHATCARLDLFVLVELLRNTPFTQKQRKVMNAQLDFIVQREAQLPSNALRELIAQKPKPNL